MTEDETLWVTDSDIETITLLGTTIADRYRVEHLLGEGGMGSVYLATDQVLERQVAIKIMKGGPMAGQNTTRFFREARSLAHLNHANIVTIYDYGWHGEQAYLVMEFATGSTLSALLEGGGGQAQGLTMGRALDIAVDVTRALAYAHAQGVIHRDIKPSNIIIGAETKLMDFGIAKMRQDPSITMSPAGMGTPAYMAPEQALGKEVDERTDLYSLGIVLYEMFTGRPPFSACDEMPLVSQHIQVTPVSPCLRNPDIPRDIERLILKMLAKTPDRRPESAQEVLSELEACRQGLPTATVQEVPARRRARPVDDPRTEALRCIPLFSSVPGEDLGELAHQLTGRRYRKGDVIFHKDDFGSTLHIVKSGNVKISIPSEEGEDVILAYLGAGDFFGELALLDEEPRSATATAVEDTETMALERGDFLQFLRWYPDTAIRILAVLSQRLRNLNSQLENLIFSNPPARLAKTLLKLMESHGRGTPEGCEISLPLTASDLSGMVGANAATVRRLLRDLQTAGVISSSKERRYTVHRPEELRERAQRGTGRC